MAPFMYSARPALADPLRHEAENQSRLTPHILLLGFHPRCASLVQLFISVDAISQKNSPGLEEWRTGIDNVDDERPWRVACSPFLPRLGLLVQIVPLFVERIRVTRVLERRIRTPTSWQEGDGA